MRSGALVVISLLCSIVHIGCATESSSCDVAAERLSGCGDEQRSAFVGACEASGGALDPDAFAASPEASEICMAPDDGKADGQATVIGTCVASMYGIKWSVASLSPTPQPLSAAMKTELRPIYGALVDQVRVSIGAALPPKIVIAGHQLSVPPAAMTFGDTIYVLQEVVDDANRYRFLLTLVHEMMHSEQSARNGGFLGFARGYCRQLANVDYAYGEVPWEDAAYATQEYARQNLGRCGHVTCSY